MEPPGTETKVQIFAAYGYKARRVGHSEFPRIASAYTL